LGGAADGAIASDDETNAVGAGQGSDSLLPTDELQVVAPAEDDEFATPQAQDDRDLRDSEDARFVGEAPTVVVE